MSEIALQNETVMCSEKMVLKSWKWKVQKQKIAKEMAAQTSTALKALPFEKK